MNDIIYPTLDLFLYDWRKRLGEEQEEINQNRANFQKKFPESLHQFLFQKDTYFEDEYVELLSNTHPFEPSDEPYRFQGYYYPVRISNVYGLLLDCSVNNETDAQPSQCFKDLKTEIKQRINSQSPTIGQTWMISGWLPQSDSKNPEDIAKDCYKALMPDSNWKQDLKGQGTFLGATIFELSRYRLVIEESPETPTNIQSIQENQHVIIILFPDQASADKLAEFYSYWMRLLWYRHTILWSYGQSRLLKHSLEKHFITIQQAIKSLKQEKSPGLDLKKIRKILEQVKDTLTPYSIELTYLDFQSRTIDINLSNYKKCLLNIEKKAQGKSDLKVLEEFSELGTDKYLLQVKKDYENLEPGLRLIDSSINTLRSRVEIDQAERDRTFQNGVAIIGVGLATGSLVASLEKLGESNDDPVRSLLAKSPVPKFWLDPATPLVYGISLGIIAALLTWLLIRVWPGLVKLIPLIPKKK
jgi:hypothetical protein